ncbi:MAG: hypothetical protein Q7V20_05195 [Aquabacterium sp.]|uniref:hypothetical protein n=1 Tax=Aquabacterium sp. TaxID=1872578 RepID=UPI0027218070|nr:hypothetical protein [Aquabacterium sp.]MDO9002830.1 hypothetical protein [Aquabacterium sp.]
MARYRKIDPRIWNDAKFRELGDNGKLVFFMLLTHPNMTALGAMRATLAGLAEELGWQPEAFRKAFLDVLSKGMAEHDSKACLVALPNFLKYNPPESPNVVKAWLSALDLLPECGLKTRVIAGAGDFAKGLTHGFTEALPEVFAKTMPIQEQEQEQEQEKTYTSARADLPCPYDAIIDIYHAALPDLPAVRLMANDRQRAMRGFWGWVLSSKKTDGTRRATSAEEALAWIKSYFERAAHNDFIMGRTRQSAEHSNWRADLDYLLTNKGRRQVIEKTEVAA